MEYKFKRFTSINLLPFTSSIDWEEYKKYLLNTHAESSIPSLLRYAKRYHNVLYDQARTKDLLLLSKAKRRLVMSALSNLSRYLGLYDYWKNTIRQYGLKWEKANPLSTIISILNTDLHDTEEWLFNVLEKLPKDASCLIAFIALTGLRIVESCNSAKLINQLSKQNQLDKYFDTNLLMLEHFRYPDLFLRNARAHCWHILRRY